MSNIPTEAQINWATRSVLQEHERGLCYCDVDERTCGTHALPKPTLPCLVSRYRQARNLAALRLQKLIAHVPPPAPHHN